MSTGRESSNERDQLDGAFQLEMGRSQEQRESAWWKRKSRAYWLGFSLSMVVSYLGYIILGLLVKFYFVKGGSRRWLSAWLQTAGWPIPALVTAFLYWKHGLRFKIPKPKLLAAYILLGFLYSISGFLTAWGVSFIPASTAGILFSSQLAFNAGFAYLLVDQKLTAFSWNAVMLVTSAAIILALDTGNDKPPAGVTKRQVILGYVMTIGASAMMGLINPLTELAYAKLVKKRSSVLVVLEFQAYVSFVATIVSSVAMAINHDFRAIHREAAVFQSGETAYYHILIWTALAAQLLYIAIVGTIFLGSALLAGIISASLIPVGSILAALFFHESFDGLKGMSIFISAWGSASYLYGSYLDMKKNSSVL